MTEPTPTNPGQSNPTDGGAPPDGSQLVHDWNPAEVASRARPRLLDQTLRDGLQSPSVRQPSLEGKLSLLRRMVGVGVDAVDAGMPSSGELACKDTTELIRAIDTEKLPLWPICSGRMTEGDTDQILRVAEGVGHSVEAYLFVATSRVRAKTEGWTDKDFAARIGSVVRRARGAGLSVGFVAEDASRTAPPRLLELIEAALDAGAERVCLCDTTGSLLPEGTRRLVEFVRETLDGKGFRHIGIDWHGHEDRGLGLANALVAGHAGADLIHATALGEGERAGNTALELVVVNWVLLGILPLSCLAAVPAYAETAARALEVPIDAKHPVIGRDAFRTATGVHASAIAKAEQQSEPWLADHVYSSIPAGPLGRAQEICVGALSGHANVEHWLRRAGINANPALVEYILGRAKRSDHVLCDRELQRWVGEAKTPPE